MKSALGKLRIILLKVNGAPVKENSLYYLVRSDAVVAETIKEQVLSRLVGGAPMRPLMFSWGCAEPCGASASML